MPRREADLTDRDVPLWGKVAIVFLSAALMEFVIRLVQLRRGGWIIEGLAFLLPLVFAVFLSLTINKKEKGFSSDLETERVERDKAQELYQEEAATRMQVEVALERNRELTSAAIEAANIGILDWDLITGEQVWSDIRKELFGLSKSSETDLNLTISRIHPDDRHKVKQAVREAIHHRRAYRFEYRVVWPDGRVHWLWATGRVFADAAGTPTRLSGAIMNIDDRKLAEDAARSKSALLEAQMNSTVDGILVVDPQGSVLLHNKQFVELFKIPQALVDEKDDQRILQYATPLVKNPQQFLENIHYLHNHPNQTSCDEIELKDERIVHRYSSPVIGEDGKYYGRLWVFRDITESKRSEDALRQLFLAVEQSPVSVVITDPHANITYVNPKFTEVTGYKAEEVIGKNPKILNSGLTAPEVYRDLWSAMREGREWHGEFHNQKKNGDKFWEAATICPIKNEQGAIVSYLGLKEDITEKKRSEEELHASRQMLQSILDAIPQRVFWKDKNGAYLGCNRPFAMDAGVPAPSVIVGKNDFELSWAGVAGNYRADDQQVMRQRAAKLNFHERQTRPDGSELWLHTNKLPLFGLQGEVIGVVGTYEDITEQKRAERELRLTKSSLDNASDSVFWVDRHGHIVYANGAACRTLKRSREELQTMSSPALEPLFPSAIWAEFWEKLKARGSLTIETQQQDKDGRVFPVEVNANFLEFDGQEYCFAFTRDVSERREWETQLRQAQKLEAIGQLAAGIAHEINTPSQYIGDNTGFLKESWTSIAPLFDGMRQIRAHIGNGLTEDELKDFDRRWAETDIDYLQTEIPKALEQALDGVHRVNKIVRAMKEFSHPGAEEKQAIDINQAVQTTVTVARNEWKYVADLEMLLDPALPPVPCHSGEFNQVILNLLVNAAHAIEESGCKGFKEKGKITIRTRRDAEGVELSITDTGAGIPGEVQSRIFEPFFTTKPVGKGTGQGLALARNTIVKRHGGKIWFETTPGKGTTFFIYLPFSASSPDAPKP